MKLSKSTINIFNSFANINSNIVVKAGNILTTISEDKSIIGVAKLDDIFPKDFGIYYLHEFLNTLNLVSDFSLEFTNEKYIDIFGDCNNITNIKYYTSDIDLLTTQPLEKLPRLPEVTATFKLSNLDINKIKKAASVLHHNNVIISYDDNLKKILCKVINPRDVTSNVYTIKLPEYSAAKMPQFNCNINIDSLKILLPLDYVVEVCAEPPIIKFIAQNVEYYIAMERN